LAASWEGASDGSAGASPAALGIVIGVLLGGATRGVEQLQAAVAITSPNVGQAWFTTAQFTSDVEERSPAQ
jgi:hypothetical protein